MRLLFDSMVPGSSFFDLLRQVRSDLLPQMQIKPDGLSPAEIRELKETPHGTTILALRFRDGSLIAGDRQATEGFQVSSRRIEKVYKADAYSAIAIAGVAGPCIELAKLFEVELTHYEKLEGMPLSLEGKANKLSQMVKANLPMAMQGLVVIPIFVGYDVRGREGKIFKYDVTGGRYEETDYYATGSGGKDARSTMKKLYRDGMTEDEAIAVGLEALIDAAEEDVGTGGPDFVRGLFPTVKIAVRSGLQDVPETRIKEVCQAIIDRRKSVERGA
ncbi:MAG: proteasome subunit beta [Candidatus Methylomirabilota bacterium]|nr:proteasome subunit beta [candidate division NC10 bacterium]PWB45958.1 MAG: proteasome subunit beta [candidate division NC10 bacterium]